jgi:hypothetical protein
VYEIGKGLHTIRFCFVPLSTCFRDSLLALLFELVYHNTVLQTNTLNILLSPFVSTTIWSFHAPCCHRLHGSVVVVRVSNPKVMLHLQ